MSSWTELLAQAESRDHVVQLYGEDDQLLARNVSRYLAEGITRLDGLVVITTPEHTQAIARHLAEEGASTTLEARREGRLVFLDARTTLDRILTDGRPDSALFDSVVGEAMREVRARSGSGKVRAFGEMVGCCGTKSAARKQKPSRGCGTPCLPEATIVSTAPTGSTFSTRTWTRRA